MKTRKLLGEAARVLATGGKYMLFSAFSNDGMGHKDMTSMLAHPGFGGEVEVSVFGPPGVVEVVGGAGGVGVGVGLVVVTAA